MINFTTKSFWDELENKYPNEIAQYKGWIDEYKRCVDWDNSLFGRSPKNGECPVKYHDLPSSAWYQGSLTDNGFVCAVRAAVKGLIFRNYFDVNTGKIIKVNDLQNVTPISALNAAIGLGGGHTLHPNIENYWMVDYWPGIKLILVKEEDGIIINEKVSRNLVIKIAEECLSDFKKQPKQLELF